MLGSGSVHPAALHVGSELVDTPVGTADHAALPAFDGESEMSKVDGLLSPAEHALATEGTLEVGATPAGSNNPFQEIAETYELGVELSVGAQVYRAVANVWDTSTSPGAQMGREIVDIAQDVGNQLIVDATYTEGADLNAAGQAIEFVSGLMKPGTTEKAVSAIGSYLENEGDQYIGAAGIESINATIVGLENEIAEIAHTSSNPRRGEKASYAGASDETDNG